MVVGYQNPDTSPVGRPLDSDIRLNELIERQFRIAEVMRNDYAIKLNPLGMLLSDVVSPRWIRLPFELVSGGTFEAVQKQRRQIAHCVATDYCDIALDRDALWISFPRNDPETIYLRDILLAEQRPQGPGLWAAVGVSMKNELRATDISTAPHLLLVGTSGSGKTVFQNSLITSLAYWYPPYYLHMILCDGKGGIKANDGFGVFGHPSKPVRLAHLQPFPVISEVADMIRAINWLVALMEKRQRSPENRPLPYYVLVIDELADIVALGGTPIVETLLRLLHRSRSAGIHVIAATAKADKASIGGLSSFFKKRAVLTTVRASDGYMAANVGGTNSHLLLMNGDMLFGAGDRYEHVQGFMVGDDDIAGLLAARGRLQPNQATLPPGDELPPAVEPRGRGRPVDYPTPAEIDAARQFVATYGSDRLTQRYIVQGHLTGRTMGSTRARRIIDAVKGIDDHDELPPPA